MRRLSSIEINNVCGVRRVEIVDEYGGESVLNELKEPDGRCSARQRAFCCSHSENEVVESMMHAEMDAKIELERVDLVWR